MRFVFGVLGGFDGRCFVLGCLFFLLLCLSDSLGVALSERGDGLGMNWEDLGLHFDELSGVYKIELVCVRMVLRRMRRFDFGESFLKKIESKQHILSSVKGARLALSTAPSPSSIYFTCSSVLAV